MKYRPAQESTAAEKKAKYVYNRFHAALQTYGQQELSPRAQAFLERTMKLLDISYELRSQQTSSRWTLQCPLSKTLDFLWQSAQKEKDIFKNGVILEADGFFYNTDNHLMKDGQGNSLRWIPENEPPTVTQQKLQGLVALGFCHVYSYSSYGRVMRYTFHLTDEGRRFLTVSSDVAQRVQTIKILENDPAELNQRIVDAREENPGECLRKETRMQAQQQLEIMAKIIKRILLQNNEYGFDPLGNPLQSTTYSDYFVSEQEIRSDLPDVVKTRIKNLLKSWESESEERDSKKMWDAIKYPSENGEDDIRSELLRMIEYMATQGVSEESLIKEMGKSITDILSRPVLHSNMYQLTLLWKKDSTNVGHYVLAGVALTYTGDGGTSLIIDSVLVSRKSEIINRKKYVVDNDFLMRQLFSQAQQEDVYEVFSTVSPQETSENLHAELDQLGFVQEKGPQKKHGWSSQLYYGWTNDNLTWNGFLRYVQYGDYYVRHQVRVSDRSLYFFSQFLNYIYMHIPENSRAGIPHVFGLILQVKPKSGELYSLYYVSKIMFNVVMNRISPADRRQFYNEVKKFLRAQITNEEQYPGIFGFDTQVRSVIQALEDNYVASDEKVRMGPAGSVADAMRDIWKAFNENENPENYALYKKYKDRLVFETDGFARVYDEKGNVAIDNETGTAVEIQWRKNKSINKSWSSASILTELDQMSFFRFFEPVAVKEGNDRRGGPLQFKISDFFDPLITANKAQVQTLQNLNLKGNPSLRALRMGVKNGFIFHHPYSRETKKIINNPRAIDTVVVEIHKILPTINQADHVGSVQHRALTSPLKGIAVNAPILSFLDALGINAREVLPALAKTQEPYVKIKIKPSDPQTQKVITTIRK
jgi:hypothetical protein